MVGHTPRATATDARNALRGATGASGAARERQGLTARVGVKMGVETVMGAGFVCSPPRLVKLSVLLRTLREWATGEGALGGVF